jgi:hypothetical protein
MLRLKNNNNIFEIYKTPPQKLTNSRYSSINETMPYAP